MTYPQLKKRFPLDMPALFKGLLSQGLARVQGFTLIELLVVVSLMGILAGLGIPQLIGVYRRQLVVNAANQLVSDIKTIRNNALANDQGTYTVPGGQGGPLSDCTGSVVPAGVPANKPYVGGYRFQIDGDGLGYKQQYVFKTVDKSNNACAVPNPTPTPVVTTKLPSGVQFAPSDFGGNITFDVVSGQISAASSTAFTIKSSSSSVLTYYICVQSGRIYAQTASCT